MICQRLFITLQPVYIHISFGGSGDMNNLFTSLIY